MIFRILRHAGFILMLLAAITVSTLPLRAQFETASVLGYLRDTSGAVIANGTLMLISEEDGTTQITRSNGEGLYNFTSVKPGSYHVSAEANGFDKTTTAKFVVTVNARQRVDVTTKVGSAATEVTVSTAPTLLETETSSRGQVIGEHEIVNLPLNGRSYADLALLVPGVRKSVLENVNSTSSREASFNVNGQRSAFNNFLLDGLDNNSYGTSNQGFGNENIPPSPDAVDEFRVETSNYSAEYGRASGAVINATTKRGSNQLHGRAWEYNRNTNLNAIGPFVPTGNVKPVLIRNQFGGTVGGPIKRDRLFFFVDYEGLRQVQKTFTAATLPTAEERAGQLNVTLRNPLTGVIYPKGTAIPQGDFSPLARIVFAALPAPNNATPSGTLPSNNLQTLPRGTITDNKGDVRIDYIPGAKLVLFGRYSDHRGAIFEAPGISGDAGGNSNGNVEISNKQIALGATYNISPASILDARIGVGWNRGGKTPIGVGGASLLTQAGITNGIPTDPQIVRPLNGQSISGFTAFGAQTSNPQFQNPFVINPKLNYTLLKGRHSVKVGYEFQSISTDINDFNPSYGQDTYNGKFSAAGLLEPGTATAVAGSNAHNLADFIFGLRDTYQLNNFRVVGREQRMHFMYVQDDLKVNSQLTVNAGLRYELVTPQWEKDYHQANFDPSTNTLIQAKAGSIYDRALVNMPLTNLAPRFGFSYSANDKTVVRGGFGINYTQFNREGGENLLAYNGPYIVNASISQRPVIAGSSGGTPLCTSDAQAPTSCYRPTQQGYSVNLVAPAAFNPLNVQARYIPRNNPTGYVESYHASVQRQLGHDMVLDIAYVGSHGVHLMVLADQNQARQVTQAEFAANNIPSLPARRPISTFGAIEVAYGGGSSNYNSLQAKFEKRYGQGLYLLNAFTYSRGFDNASGHLETSGGDNSRVNIANIGGDYGPSGYDQPINNTTSAVYDLPIFRGSQGLTHSLLGGWQLTAINQFTSGLPINLTYNAASNLTVSGLPTYRANVLGNTILASGAQVKAKGGALNFLDPLGVAAATGITGVTSTNPFGNARRNSLRGPVFHQFDIGLHKAFSLWEGASIDFRAEAFNVLNQANYGTPDSNASNINRSTTQLISGTTIGVPLASGGGTYGQITTAFPARQVQLAGKFIF